MKLFLAQEMPVAGDFALGAIWTFEEIRVFRRMIWESFEECRVFREGFRVRIRRWFKNVLWNGGMEDIEFLGRWSDNRPINKSPLDVNDENVRKTCRAFNGRPRPFLKHH